MANDKTEKLFINHPLMDICPAKPGLGFENYAKVIANLINNASPPQMTVGILGGYGTGKTTLLQEIQKRLEDINAEIIKDVADTGEQDCHPIEEKAITEKSRDEILSNLLADSVGAGWQKQPEITQIGKMHNKQKPLLVVRFNAWRYDQEEHLFLPFLATILQKIGSMSNASKYLCAIMLGITRGLSLKFKLGFLEADLTTDKVSQVVKEYLQSDIERLLAEYTDVYKGLASVPLKGDKTTRQRIVVMIDDLDRCVPKKAFNLLECLKSFTDLDGFIFVLALDPRAIGCYLKEKFKDDLFVTVEEYLEKMIQIPFYLPQLTTDNLKEEIMKVLKNLKELNGGCPWAEEMMTLLQTGEKKVGDKGEQFRFIDYIPCNIRKAKRILNMHQAIMTVDETLDKEVILALLIVQNRWPLAYWALQEFINDFLFIYIDGKVSEEKELQESGSVRLLRLNPKVVRELESQDFFEIYSQKIKPFLEGKKTDTKRHFKMLGWPLDIESKIRREADNGKIHE